MQKRCNFFIFLEAIVLLFSSLGVNALNVESFDVITLEFSFPKPLVEEVADADGELYNTVSIEGLPVSSDLNQPCLPVKPIKILLPYGREFESLKVTAFEKSTVGQVYNIKQGGNIIHFERGSSKPMSKKPLGISCENLYSIVGTHVFRGFPILYVNLFPVQYTHGVVTYYKRIIVEIKTKVSQHVVRGSSGDMEMVAKLVDNPACIASYSYALKTKNNVVEYVIITNEDLAEASGRYTFQDLVRSKNNKGVSAGIFTVEDIVANPDYWVNGTWGDNNPNNPFYRSEITCNYTIFNDTQAKIRNFIRYAYMELGTNYVLLGGDADVAVEEENIIPTRGLYACEEGLPLCEGLDFEEDDIPSDVYYACLDGNFNYDMDDRWGENATDNNLSDVEEADLLAEVYVGRACVDSHEEVSNFVMKTLAYENSGDQPYLSKTLLIGEYLGFPGVSAYGGNYKDLIVPLIPECFNVETLYERDMEWDKYFLLDILNNASPHLINHLGHGFVHYALRLRNREIERLTNDRYFFIYSQTCLAGSFDNCYRDNYYEDDCAAEYFTVETPHGAFAVIMNSRFGLGSENTLYSPSQIFDESFFKALFTEDITQLGKANHYAKEDHIWHINENGIRWVYYETNLFGDPELSIKKPGIKINKIEGGLRVSATIKNIGCQYRKNIKWSIELSGDAIILLPLGGKKTGEIPSLAPGEETIIKTGFILGLGKTVVTVKAGDTHKTTNGFLVGFFIHIP